MTTVVLGKPSLAATRPPTDIVVAGPVLSIALVTGGPTMEQDGTASSLEALTEYFSMTRHRVSVLDATDLIAGRDGRLDGFDVIFNGVHGRGGEDGGLHYLAELAGVPVTGAVWWAHMLGADKAAFKAWAASSVRVPREYVEGGQFPHGVIRKPRFGGGSIDLTYLARPDAADRDALIVIEEYIPGRIVTSCAYPALAPELPVLVIDPVRPGLYDEAAKRGRAQASYLPVRADETAWARVVVDLTGVLYRRLGERGPIRFDWIVEETTGEPVLLEVNTNPGWRPVGNMARIVAAGGYSYAKLIETVLVEAIEHRN